MTKYHFKAQDEYHKNDALEEFFGRDIHHSHPIYTHITYNPLYIHQVAQARHKENAQDDARSKNVAKNEPVSNNFDDDIPF